MRVGVISDTHGDVGLEVVPLLDGRRTHFVPGNTDDPAALREAMTDPEHTFHNPLGSLEIEGCRIAFLHGDDVKLLHHTIHSGSFDLVCHGHTHAFASSRQRQTLSLNPGAISRTNRPSLAVVEIPSLDVTHVPL